MRKKLKITSDHITLIKNMRFVTINDKYYGVDTYSPWGGSAVLWDMAFMLGLDHKMLPETREDPQGPSFEPETQDYLWGLANDMIENMLHYHNIALQYCDRGFKPGIYSCDLREGLWDFEEFHDEPVEKK